MFESDYLLDVLRILIKNEIVISKAIGCVALVLLRIKTQNFMNHSDISMSWSD